MTTHRKFLFLVLATSILMVGIIVQESYAAFNLTVTPFDGGTSLRLGRLDKALSLDREVRIRITSTEGRAYQVFQRVAEPFLNEQQQSLDRQSFLSYTVVGSNTAGTLYQQDLMPLGYGEQLLYTSNPNGDSDSFSTIYKVDFTQARASGNFLGKIIYTLRPIGGGTQDESILNVYFEIPEDLTVKLEGPTGRNLVRLDTQHPSEIESTLKFTLQGNIGQRVNVYQELEDFPVNDLNQTLGPESIMFVTSGSQGGELYAPEPKPLERKRTLIYSSPETDDTFEVNFQIAEQALASLKSGTYRGRIKYLIETAGRQESREINLEVHVAPVFRLDVAFPEGGVRFHKVLPTTPPQTREVRVTVFSNLGKPYMVMQKAITTLTNEKGQEIKSEFFTLKGELIEGSPGSVKFPDFTAVSAGEIPIFVSDDRGSSASFRIVYRLKSYAEISPGEYSTNMVFSLGEI